MLFCLNVKQHFTFVEEAMLLNIKRFASLAIRFILQPPANSSNYTGRFITIFCTIFSHENYKNAVAKKTES